MFIYVDKSLIIDIISCINQMSRNNAMFHRQNGKDIFHLDYTTPELGLKQSLEDSQKLIRALDVKIDKTIKYLNARIEKNKITRNICK